MSFRRFFLVRLAWALVGLALSAALVFVIFRVPATPPDNTPWGNNEQFREITGSYWADPMHDRLGDFVGDLALRRSFGPSFATREDSRGIAVESVPATASLLAAALVVWLTLGVSIGLLAAWLKRPMRLGRALVYLAIGTSPIWLGLWASYVLSYKFAVLPFSYCDLVDPPKDECGGGADWVKGLVLPGLTLALFFAAIYARVIARFLRIPGDIPGRRRALVIGRMLGRDVGYALGAAALVEVVFGIPGLGATLVYSVSGWDLPVAETVVLLALWLAIAWHFLVDVIVGALDSDLRAEWPVASVTGRA